MAICTQHGSVPHSGLLFQLFQPPQPRSCICLSLLEAHRLRQTSSLLVFLPCFCYFPLHLVELSQVVSCYCATQIAFFGFICRWYRRSMSKGFRGPLSGLVKENGTRWSVRDWKVRWRGGEGEGVLAWWRTLLAKASRDIVHWCCQQILFL